MNQPSRHELVAVIAENRRAFLSFLERRVGHRELAEDVLQDAFARSLDRLPLASDESTVAWFYRVLRNAVIDHYRRRGASDRALAALGRQLEEEWQPGLDDAPSAAACRASRRRSSRSTPWRCAGSRSTGSRCRTTPRRSGSPRTTQGSACFAPARPCASGWCAGAAPAPSGAASTAPVASRAAPVAPTATDRSGKHDRPPAPARDGYFAAPQEHPFSQVHRVSHSQRWPHRHDSAWVQPQLFFSQRQVSWLVITLLLGDRRGRSCPRFTPDDAATAPALHPPRSGSRGPDSPGSSPGPDARSRRSAPDRS